MFSRKSSLFKLKRRTIGKENKIEKETKIKKKPVKKNKKEKTIQEEVNEAYQAWCIATDKETDFKCTAVQNDEPLQGKLLIEPVTKLSNKPPLLWNEDDVMPIVKLLSGRTAIDGTGDNSEGAWAFATISHDFNLFLDKHDEIRSLIDPTYVVADVGGQNLPNFQVGAGNYPPAGSPINRLTRFMRSNYVWVFNGAGATGRAQHLVGWIQASVPGLRMFLFSTNTPAQYF